jgi:hypothetical protein
MTTDSWRVRVSVRGAGLPGFGPGHARHAPSCMGLVGMYYVFRHSPTL